MDQATTTVMPASIEERDTDQELVRRYLDGDMPAFDALMARHERHVYRICFRFVRNRDDALDLTQDVFVKAFEKLPAFRGDARFKTWLYRIAVNHCLNHVKKNSREFVEVTDAIGSIGPAAEGNLLDRERRAMVQEMMAYLPPRQKAILELRLEENLSYDEIAAVVDRSVSTVKSSIFFALTKLKKLASQPVFRGRAASARKARPG